MKNAPSTPQEEFLTTIEQRIAEQQAVNNEDYTSDEQKQRAEAMLKGLEVQKEKVQEAIKGK